MSLCIALVMIFGIFGQSLVAYAQETDVEKERTAEANVVEIDANAVLPTEESLVEAAEMAAPNGAVVDAGAAEEPTEAAAEEVAGATEEEADEKPTELSQPVEPTQPADGAEGGAGADDTVEGAAEGTVDAKLTDETANYSSTIKYAPGAKDGYYGGESISLYNEVIISGNDTKLEEGSYTLIYLPKDKFSKPVAKDISLEFENKKDMEITETDTDYVIKTSYKPLYGGYSFSTPLKVRLIPNQVVLGSENIIRQEFHDADGIKLTDSEVIVNGLSMLESVDYNNPRSAVAVSVDENNRISAERIEKFYPGSIHHSITSSDKNDPRDRRVYAELPEGVTMKENSGWTQENSPNKWYKDIKRTDVPKGGLTADINLQGLDLTEHDSEKTAKEVRVNYKMYAIENGGLVENLNPATWYSVRSYYRNNTTDSTPGYASTDTRSELRFIDKQYNPIQKSKYTHSWEDICLPYHKENLDEYRLDFYHKVIYGLTMNYPKGDGASDELNITSTMSYVPGYSYPSEIRINLNDNGMEQRDKDNFAKMLEGTKAYGINYQDEKVLLTENVPIAHNGEGEYFKFDGKAYRGVEFEYPNGGFKLTGREQIDKFKSVLGTTVIADIRPEIIDRLKQEMNEGRLPMVGAHSENPHLNTSYVRTMGSLKYKRLEADAEPTSVDFSISDHVSMSYMLQSDEIFKESKVRTTNGNGFFVEESIHTKVAYRHVTHGNADDATTPENLNIYYLVPDGIEPIENPKEFTSIEVVRGYKDGYNLVVAKPKSIRKPYNSGQTLSYRWNYYYLNFNITSRVEIGDYTIYSALCIDNNEIENIDGKQYGILQKDTPSGLFSTITEDAANRSEKRDKFTDLGSAEFKILPPHVLVAMKNVKMSTDADTQYWSSLGKKAKIGDDIDYRWTLSNNSPSDIRRLTVIDILPYEGDTAIIENEKGEYPDRGSEFKTPLKSVDAGEKFDVYYTTDEVKGTIDENKMANWVTHVDDMSKVTMIKTVLKNNAIIAKGEKYHIVTHNFIENDNSIKDQAKAYNSFAVSTNNEISFMEALKTEVEVNYPKKDVELTKVDAEDNEIKLEGVKFDLYSDQDVLLKEDLVTNRHGVVIIPDLLIGRTYYLVEKETAEGYNLKKGHVDFTVSEGEGDFKLVVENNKIKPWIPLTPAKTKVTVSKKWQNHAGNEIPATVESITVKLYRDGEETDQTIQLTADNNWTSEFTDLPNLSGIPGVKYNYSVKEVGETGGYVQLNGDWFTVSYNGDMQTGYTVVNKEMMKWTPMEPPTRKVKVTKEWKNQAGEDLTAPVENVEVELYKNGVATGQTLTLNADNQWSGVFEGLEVADGLGSTNYYQYTVKEIGENGKSIQLNGKNFTVSYAGDMKDGFSIINKYDEPKQLEEKPNKNPSKNSPKTGDTQNLFLYSMVMTISGMAVFVFRRLKRKNGKNTQV